MYVLPRYFSIYYPDDLKKDLIVVPFETQYGVIELIFYKINCITLKLELIHFK